MPKYFHSSNAFPYARLDVFSAYCLQLEPYFFKTAEGALPLEMLQVSRARQGSNAEPQALGTPAVLRTAPVSVRIAMHSDVSALCCV